MALFCKLQAVSNSRIEQPREMVLISSGTDDAVSSVTNSSSLVFGIMGVGTFLLFFFFLVVVGVCIFSTPCSTKSKVIARGVSVVLFIVVFLVLIFADHQSQFSSTGFEQQVNDRLQPSSHKSGIFLILFLKSHLISKRID